MWKSKGSDKLAEVKWIKIITGIFDDEKIQLIEQMPDSDTILVIWFKLLCLAGKTNNHGIIMLSDKIPYTDEMLSTIFRRPLNTVRLALKTFENFGMIEIVDGIVTITNWEKHQSGDKLESIREYNRLAKQNERERKKKLLCQGNVIDSQGTDIEVDIDKDIDNKESIEKTPDKPDTKFPYEQLRESFIKNCPSLPKPNEIKDWTVTRKKAIRDKKLPIAGFTTIFKRIEKSDFLTGRKTGWCGCSLDWILKPANWQKINEGNYDNRGNNLSESKDLTFDVDEYERATNPLYEK